MRHSIAWRTESYFESVVKYFMMFFRSDVFQNVHTGIRVCLQFRNEQVDVGGCSGPVGDESDGRFLLTAGSPQFE